MCHKRSLFCWKNCILLHGQCFAQKHNKYIFMSENSQKSTVYILVAVPIFSPIPPHNEAAFYDTRILSWRIIFALNFFARCWQVWCGGVLVFLISTPKLSPDYQNTINWPGSNCPRNKGQHPRQGVACVYTCCEFWCGLIDCPPSSGILGQNSQASSWGKVKVITNRNDPQAIAGNRGVHEYGKFKREIEILAFPSVIQLFPCFQLRKLDQWSEHGVDTSAHSGLIRWWY